MAKLVVNNWSDDLNWVDETHWPLKAFCYRIELCSKLRGTELKRVARSLKNKEITELNDIDPGKADPLINTLESLGANVSIIK